MKLRQYSNANLVEFLYLIIIFSKLQSRLTTPLYNDDYILLIGTILISAICMFKQKGKYPVIWVKLMGILILYILLFTFVFTNSEIIEFTYKYALAYLAYVILVFSFSLYMYIQGIALQVIRHTFYLISIFLIVCFTIHINEVNILRIVTDFFLAERDRVSFGFVQANTTAELCIASLALSLIMNRVTRENGVKVKKYKRWIIAVINILIILMLIITASRGGILAAASLYGTYYFMILENKKQKISIKRLRKCIIIAFLLLASLFFYFEFIASNVFDISYRIRNFTVNIPTLINSNRLFIGLGFADKGVFGNSRHIAGTQYTDNYLLYVLVSTGIIGLVIILTYSTILVLRIRSQKRTDSKIGILSCLVMVAVFSLTEADFINPASVLSITTMTLFITYIIGGMKKNNSVNKMPK